MSNTQADSNDPQNDPYFLLGIDSGASFEQIKEARDKKLVEAGDDLMLRAKIEVSYDSLLMSSLKARQSGKVSNAAVDASQKEQNNSISKGFGGSLLSRISNLNGNTKLESSQTKNISVDFNSENGSTIRIAIGFLAVILFLVSPDQYIQIILSLSTIALFISQIKRGRKFFQSLGWSSVFLACGYILGGIVVNSINVIDDQSLLLSLDKLQALPVMILLWIGSMILE